MNSDSSSAAEHQVREGAPPNDGPVGGLPGPSAETDRSATPEGEGPSGLPDQEAEGTPLGTTEADPEGEGESRRGEEHMPGIPTAGEPPTSG